MAGVDSKEVSYWDSVYAAGRYVRGEIPHNASPFAQASLPVLKGAVEKQLAADKANGRSERQIVVWEWGCGNGRDATYFAEQGLRVVGLDISAVAIQQLNDEHSESKKLVFVTGDFTNEKNDPDAVVKTHFAQDGMITPAAAPTDDEHFVVGAIYSRFTIHSVREAAASNAYRWAFSHLNSGGVLCIETRSVKDSLCGVGTAVEGERNAWIEDHYRRFTHADELEQELKEVGFAIDKIIESTGLAKYKDEDPCILRIFARKP